MVIGWGAFVRMSGSGDGCGKSWPLCQGAIIPEGEVAHVLQTWIEFFHRLKSGLLGLGIFFLAFVAFRFFKRPHPIRWAAVGAVFFTVTEALLGAWLVLGGLVDTNESSLRVFAVGLHSLNTLMLLASLVLTYVWAVEERFSIDWKAAGIGTSMWIALVGFLLIAASGSIASLSNTLYPSASLVSGFHADFSLSSPGLVRMRWLHPLIAFSVAGFLIYFSIQLKSRLAKIFPLLVLVGIAFGIATLFSLSPLWMRIVHLLWADLIWICLVSMAGIAVIKKGAQI